MPELAPDRSSLEGEREWRLTTWSAVLRHQNEGDWLAPSEVQERRIYRGGRGIFADLETTRRVDERGLTVSILHTGEHYADLLGNDGLLYNYPETDVPGRDENEVAATKAAAELELPIFVVTYEAPDNLRRLYLGWVEDWSDPDQQFLITFDTTPLEDLTYSPDVPDDAPFELVGAVERTSSPTRRNAGQQKFRRDVLARYGSRCPLSGVTVPEMLEAAHLRDFEHDGSNDPRNGIPLNAALHRAFDRQLFAIDPETLEVVTAPEGASVRDMGITVPNLGDLERRPHPSALEWRWQQFSEKWEL